VATTDYVPKYQTYSGLTDTANSIYDSMASQRASAAQSIYANANQGLQGTQDYMASKGMNSSGGMINRMQGLYNDRNTNLASSDAGFRSQALTQAGTAAQLGLTEQAQMQAQQNYEQNYANTLAQQALQNQYNQAGLTGQYNGQQTLAAQTLAEQQKQAALDEAYRQSQLSQQGSQFTQQLTSNNQNALNQLAAGIMASYAAGTDKFTLPSSVVSLLNSIFTQGG